jgi:hypothetical protein
MLICYERKVPLAGCCGWFVLREKYWWLVADKPNEQDDWPWASFVPQLLKGTI